MFNLVIIKKLDFLQGKSTQLIEVKSQLNEEHPSQSNKN